MTLMDSGVTLEWLEEDGVLTTKTGRGEECGAVSEYKGAEVLP